MEIPGENQSLKNCHYFNNKEACPNEEIGCKFLHAKSSKCRFDECRNLLCPFSHEDEDENNLDIDEEDHDKELELKENQCHLCRKQFQSKDDQIEHVSKEHIIKEC